MARTRKTLVLELTLTFEGDYYTPSELEMVANDWIDAGFCDRDDLIGWFATRQWDVTETPLKENES